jgi:hypothetical protein
MLEPCILSLRIMIFPYLENYCSLSPPQTLGSERVLNAGGSKRSRWWRVVERPPALYCGPRSTVHQPGRQCQRVEGYPTRAGSREDGIGTA